MCLRLLVDIEKGDILSEPSVGQADHDYLIIKRMADLLDLHLFQKLLF